MSPHPFRLIAFTLMALIIMSLAACQMASTRSGETQVNQSATTKALDQLGPLNSSAGTASGNVRNDLASSAIKLPDYVPVRRYRDVYTNNGVNTKVIVEYGWDYRNGIAVETVYNDSGAQISREQKPGLTMALTDREVELAIALEREDPRLHDLLADDTFNFYAGFAFREADDPDCNLRSRCVHVIVSSPGYGERHVAHSIVDLMKRKVVHPFYEPNREPYSKPNKS